MSYHVAIQSFTDPSDGGEILKGRTFVSHQADVFRRFPERFKAVSGHRSGGITRTRAPKRPAKKTPAAAWSRPYWLLGEDEPWRLR